MHKNNIAKTLEHIFDVHHQHFDQIDSTNTRLLLDIAHDIKRPDTPSLYTAVTQTAGRGQHGRTWVSGKGNVFLSLYIPLQSTPSHTLNLQHLSGLLSLTVGYHLLQLDIIQKINHSRRHQNLPPIGVKWANDLGFYDASQQHFQKLAGVLIEPAFKKVKQKSHMTGVVVGVGLNVSSTPVIHDGLYQATSLSDLTDSLPSYQDLYKPITQAIVEAVIIHNHFKDVGKTNAFIHAYNESHVLNHKTVQIFLQNDMHNVYKEGKCLGIQSDGSLLLQIAEESVPTPIFAGMAQIKKVHA